MNEVETGKVIFNTICNPYLPNSSAFTRLIHQISFLEVKEKNGEEIYPERKHFPGTERMAKNPNHWGLRHQKRSSAKWSEAQAAHPAEH